MRACEFIVEYKNVPAEHFNGIELSLEIQKDDEYVDDEDYDNQVVYVKATSNGRELGHVLFSVDGEYLMPQDLEVEERFRGQGIAQTMYDFVKSKGYKIRRSSEQTDAGAGFWDKHRPEQQVWEEVNPDITMEHAVQDYSEYSKEFNGLDMSIQLNNRTGNLTVMAYDDGQLLGQVLFKLHGGTRLYPWQLDVEPQFRGKGIAKAMYDFAKGEGFTIHRSTYQTDAGSVFWDKHRGKSATVWESQLTEAASAVLYHYTNTAAAAKIMTSGEFLLASSTGTQAEKDYEIPGYPYFLSTTRTRVGDYHNRYVGSSAVMFVLNGSWLNNNYKTKPIDYWNRAWQHDTSGKRTREAEDRVYSRTPAIPANAESILEVHVLITEQSENRSPEVRTVLLSAKKQGIPAFLYTDETAWKLQNKRKSVSPAAAAELLQGPQPSRASYGPRRNYLEDWLELIYKKNKGELSPSALKKVHSLVVYGQGYRNEDDGLGTDLSNARKPGNADYPSAVKINSFMRRNNIATPVDLKNYLVDKWKDLY